MSTPGVPLLVSHIDIDALVAPVDGGAGAGTDLRFTPAYNTIIEARREENARLPQGIWTRDVKRADWPLVESLCADILRTRSKDLLVACWLAEAVIHRVGFAGLACGLQLLTALCRCYWPALHPAIDDGDLAPRLAPFEWLNTRIPILLRNMPIVRSVNSPELAYTWTDYVNAQLLEALRQRDLKSVERSEAAGAVTSAAFAAVRERTDTLFWRETAAALQAAMDALAELNATLEGVCGRESPGLGAIAHAVKDLAGLTSVALAERQPAPPPARRVAVSPALILEAPVVTASPQPNTQTRADAYAQLADIAELLHRLEPHSPVSYLIRRAVAWGDMSFAELVMTFSMAGLDLSGVFEVLGLAQMSEELGSFEGGDEKA
jgi:type VI secretion system ImpA family protein